jgi:hypothetical protein
MQKKFDKCEHFCKWTARMVPLGTPAVAILYILTSPKRFRSWSFYRYRKHFGDPDHCSPSPSVKTDDRWNRENKEFASVFHMWVNIDPHNWVSSVVIKSAEEICIFYMYILIYVHLEESKLYINLNSELPEEKNNIYRSYRYRISFCYQWITIFHNLS